MYAPVHYRPLCPDPLYFKIVWFQDTLAGVHKQVGFDTGDSGSSDTRDTQIITGGISGNGMNLDHRIGMDSPQNMRE